MGLFSVDVYVSSTILQGAPGVGETLSMLVDTGATYSVIPPALAERLKLPTVREQAVELAGGMQVTRPVVPIWVRVDGREAPSVALVWGGQPLLGAIALEGLGLGVDPVNKRLVPVVGFIGEVTDR